MIPAPVLDTVGPRVAGLLVRASTASPEPAEVVDTPPVELVTPGTLGFLVTFAVAVVVVLLLRDMVRRNRRIQVRAERRDAERREQEGSTSAAGPTGPAPTGTVRGPGREAPDEPQGPVVERRRRRRGGPPAR